MLSVFLPTLAFAQVSEEEFWANHTFLYRFVIAADASTGSYTLSTGDVAIGSGPWELVVLGATGQEMTRQSFTVGDGPTTVPVRYQPNGTTALVQNPAGERVLTIDLQGSRICNEDGICDAQYGEVSSNCPIDCGTYQEVGPTASITQQSGFGQKIGLVLMSLSLAATGILLIRGVSMLLDRRHGA